MLNFFLCAYFTCCGQSDWLKNVIPVFIVSCISYETRKLVSSDLPRRYTTVNGGASERYYFNPIVTIQKRDGLHLFSICLFNVDLTLPLTLPCTVLRQGLLQPWRMGWINHHQVHSSSKERKSKKTKSLWVRKPKDLNMMVYYGWRKSKKNKVFGSK